MTNNRIEIKDSSKICRFLDELIRQKKGQLLLDFYSYYFYDEIIKVERIEVRIFKLYWKDADVRQHDIEVFPCYFMYSLVKIDKVVLDKKVYIKANLLKKERVREILSLDRKISIVSDANNLFSEVKFRDDDGRYHDCIISDMPFYSMSISNKGSNFYKSEMYYLNMDELANRFDRINSKIENLDEDNEEEIGEKGNSIRKILERILKIYIIVKEYHNFENNKNENDYDRLTLGPLMMLLHKNKDEICEFLCDDMRNISNKFWHDCGESPTLDELKKLRYYTEVIFEKIMENIDTTLL